MTKTFLFWGHEQCKEKRNAALNSLFHVMNILSFV